MFDLIMLGNEVRRECGVYLHEHSLLIKCELLQVLRILRIRYQLVLVLAYLLEMLHVGHIFTILILDVLVEHLVDVFVVNFS